MYNINLLNQPSKHQYSHRSFLFFKPRYLLLALFCLSFGACDKTDGPAIGEIVQPVPRIKEITTYFKDLLVEKTTFEYDQQGRQVKTSNSAGFTSTLIYESGKILKEVYSPYDNSKTRYTYILNDKGLVVYEEESKERSEYDVQGYRIMLISHLTHINTIEKGNFVKTARWNTRGGVLDLLAVATRTFLEERPNTIGNENMGISFWGRQNKNPPIREINTDMRNNQVNPVLDITYQYEFDAKNRIIKSSSSNIHDSYIIYTYVE